MNSADLVDVALKEKHSRSRAYPTDLMDEQWAIMEALLPATKTEGRTGRPREHSYREIINGIFYVLRTGCTWDMMKLRLIRMPHDLPPWATCQHYFSQWSRDGTWQSLHDTLREKVRVKLGRELTPFAAVMDRQSVKTAEKGGKCQPSLKNRTLLVMMSVTACCDMRKACQRT